MPKIKNENQFLMSIKGHNSVVLICHNLPICNPKTLLPNINSYTKSEEHLKNAPGRERTYLRTETDRQTDTRTQIFEQRV